MWNWKSLAPHRPLDGDDARHVLRPGGGGQRLAQLVQAGDRAIVVIGPVGSGKSTEVAHAAALLQHTHRPCLIRLDRLLDMRRAREVEILRRIVTGVTDRTPWQQRSRTEELLAAAMDWPVSPPSPSPSASFSEVVDYLRAVVRDPAQSETVLILDGLEKAPDEVARALVQSLLDLSDDVRLILVLPPSLVLGPQGYEIASRSRVFNLRAIGFPERSAFMRSILSQRLGLNGELPPELAQLVPAAAKASGGVPRVFLQIMHDAATHAALGGRELPNQADLDNAMLSQSENLALALRDGDAEILAGSRGTSGLEVPLERRLRFLAHGLLLEYDDGGGHVHVEPAPLLASILPG